MADPALILVQRRAHKTGAQVGLAHLLAHPSLRDTARVLLVSKHGWLTGEAERHGVRTIAVPFPSSRSLPDRLIGVRRFAVDALRKLDPIGLAPAVVVANDHVEGLIAAELARQAGCRSVMILRSSGMSERDFFKYRCDRFDRVYAAGEELAAKAGHWAQETPVVAFHDGVGAGQFRAVKAKPAKFPDRVLVVGSHSPAKGWRDAVAAIDILERDPDFPALTLDFTGSADDAARAGVELDRPRRACLNFIGREADFAALVRRYDLVIHPSRNESVGLAMLETIAAGVPLLCSRAGVVEDIGKSDDWLFRPGDPADLAARIDRLWRHWPSIAGDGASAQWRVRNRYLADDTLCGLTGSLLAMMPAAAVREAEIVR